MTKNIKFYLGIIFILFNLIVIPNSFAANLTASVDRSKIAVNEEIQLSITAVGSNPSEPDVPLSNDLDISFSGTSSNMQIINGNMSSSETFNYKVTPKKTGKLTIPAISSEIEGQKYSTQPIDIEVDKADEKTSINKDNLVFVTVQVDNVKPYVDQQVMYIFRLFRKVQTGSNQLKYPDFKDFWVEETGKAIEYEKSINGERYIVTEVKKALYPTKTGHIEIPPTIFNVEVLYKDSDGFGSIFDQTRSEPKSFVTNSIKLNVKDLPNNKPANFTNLVGSNLTLNASFSENNIKAGDSVTLNVSLKGIGNINDLKKLPLNIKDVKIYEDKSSTNSHLQGDKLATEKNFKYAIVPLKEGKLNIPPLKISYFDTQKNSYQVITSKPLSLNVGKSDDPNFVAINPVNKSVKADVKTTGTDIFDIHTGSDILKNQGLSLIKLIIYFIWFILPVIIYIYLFTRNKDNVKKPKSAKIYKQTIDNINQLEKSTDNDISKKASDILKYYLSQKFNIQESYLQPNKISEITEIPEQYISEIKKLMEEYEYIKFSGNNNSAKNSLLLNSTKSLINKLEGIKK